MADVPRIHAEHSLTRALVEAVDTIDYVTLDTEDRRAIRCLVLDHLGVAAAGAATDSADVFRRYADRVGGSNGPELPIVGAARLAPAMVAALANAAAGHCVEFDDLHNASSSHPGTVIIPAALAAASMTQATDAEALAAIAVGYEVMCRVGRALNPAAHYERHFHPTATAGTVGVAATVARLHRLDPTQTTCAIGVACDMAAGGLGFLTDGSWVKRLHPAMALRSGFEAVMLAEDGMVGPVDGIAGPRSFLAGYSSRPQPELLLHQWGQTKLEVRNTSIKAHACCRYNQGPVDALLHIRSEHGVDPRDVSEIAIGLPSAAVDLVAEPAAAKQRPSSVVDAQFSMPYAAAVALSKGRAGVGEFVPSLLCDPDLEALMDLVTCHGDPRIDADYPEQWHAWACVTTVDGDTFEAWIEDPKGDPPNPMTDTELRDKFDGLASSAYDDSARDAIAAACSELGEPGSLTALFAALAP